MDTVPFRGSETHLMMIPVDGLFHGFHNSVGIDDEYVRKCLAEFNAGPALDEGVPNPARVEAKIDDTEAVVWFSPNPTLAENIRAQKIISDIFGWYMVFYGAVGITGLSEEQVVEILRTYS